MFKAALRAAATAGATHGLGEAAGVASKASTLGQRAAKAAVNATATTGVGVAFGDDMGAALRAGIRSGAATVAQGMMASAIGDAKADGNLGRGAATALHGVAGGLAGGVMDGVKGIAPGAVGSMMGELTAETLHGDGKGLSPEAAANAGKVMGAALGGVADMAQGGDGTKGVGIGTFTAAIAVEENFLAHIAKKVLGKAAEKAAKEGFKLAKKHLISKGDAAKVARALRDKTANSNITSPEAMRTYVREVEKATGSRLTPSQRESLVDAVRTNRFEKLGEEAYKAHNRIFKDPKTKDSLIR